MKSEASQSSETIAKKSYEEDPVMALLETVPNTSNREDEEEGIGQGIDNLGSVYGSIVILVTHQWTPCQLYFI